MPSICCVSSSVCLARFFDASFNFGYWHSVWDGAYVCSCISSKNHLTVRAWLWRYTDTHFADKYTPTYWILLTSFFCGHTYIHPFFDSFCCPFLLQWTPYHFNIQYLANNLQMVPLNIRKWRHKYGTACVIEFFIKAVCLQCAFCPPV